MPLGDDLLSPISQKSPCGENLRYSPIYDKIKEARRKEDPVAQGDWQRALKEADYPLVIKLSKEALKQKGKDLQVAAWLTEALVYEEGLAGLTAGLNLMSGLLETFWDEVYPKIEDDDPGLRAAPLSWVGEYRDLEIGVRNIGLTRSGLSWFKYKESRAVGYESDVSESDSKRHARSEAISEGKTSPEEFDADVLATSLSDLEQLLTDAGTSLDSLSSLDELCQQKFGDDAPGFRILRLAIEDVQHTARMLATSKREKAPPAASESEPEIEEENVLESADSEQPAAAVAPKRERMRKSGTAAPANRDDAFQCIIAAAAYLRSEDANSPVPYLLLRGWRWGEIRAAGGVNPDLLEAPPTEIRQQLKRLMHDEEWEKVLETAESAMASPAGRGWLDLQRYVVKACTGLGSSYDAISSAIQSELRALLKDLPQLPSMTLLDDTATANAETQSWLGELFLPGSPAESQSVAAELDPVGAIDVQEKQAGSIEENKSPDIYQLALEEVRAGNGERALEMLSRQISEERSGRGRFMRKMQLSQICIYSNRHTIAHSILQELAQEVEQRKLDTWEPPEAIAQMLALLLQSMQKLRFDEQETSKVYSQICRLDPIQAARLAD